MSLNKTRKRLIRKYRKMFNVFKNRLTREIKNKEVE